METLRRALFNSFVIVVIFLVGFNGPVLAEELETIEPLNESVTLLENETNESILPNSCEGELCVQYEENGVESDDSLNEATTSATDDYNSVIVASTNDESQTLIRKMTTKNLKKLITKMLKKKKNQQALLQS